MKGSNPFIIVLVQRLETGVQHQYQAFIDRLTRNLNIVVAPPPVSLKWPNYQALPLHICLTGDGE